MVVVFGKWDSEEVKVQDPGLMAYINFTGHLTYHTHGKHSKVQFAKSQISIVERLINTMMRSGSGKKVGGHLIDGRMGCGKKTKATACVEGAFNIIGEKTKQNPLQVYVKALENSAPREETTRLKFGGITKLISVDISPQRRIDFALRNIGVATLGKSYKSKKVRAEALADELIAAANNDNASLSISKRLETERVAKGAR